MRICLESFDKGGIDKVKNSMNGTPETTEQYSSHIPALQTLVAMGWSFMSTEKCLSARGSMQEVLMPNVLIEELSKRRFEYKGNKYQLSSNAIEQIVRELSVSSLHEGLLSSNERFYNKLCLGTTVTEFIDGKKHSPTISIIDWENLSTNSFIVTEELEVLSSDGTHTRKPDIVCYVNGIPLAIIEAKRPDSGSLNKSIVDEGISQNIRNQKRDEIPHLFIYSQLLLSISGTDGRYGTTATPKKFWAKWREEEFEEDHFSKIKNTPLSYPAKATIFANRPLEVREYFESLWSEKQMTTDQDRLIISLLSPKQFLEFIRFYLLFDQRVGKVAARYQQAFGVKSLVKRIKEKKPEGGREDGVIWHTTGSGKSFTMVFLCKALLLHPDLKNCRIVVVTDRIDLEKQLARTFLTSGAFGSEIAGVKKGEKAKVSSGKDLANRIGKGNERIIFTIIDKFNTASKLPECRNDSEDIIVIVDEGHRSHGGETHERMKHAIPNASYIAFTGTPLLKGEKTTEKFGPIIHTYTMRRAVEDHTVTPLLYEERRSELNVTEEAIDNWFEKITASLSDRQRNDLKKKWGNKGPLYGSANRIELIAWDIAVHFNENFKKLGQGLKGEVATDSRLSAIRYKKYLDKTGLVSSAVVISPPDTRKEHYSIDERDVPEVQQWWRENIQGNQHEYERDVVERFGTDDPPDLLIVVDKLLTGFDEPRNAVLYIDKPLKQHNLIQAVARVNRLHDAKDYGLLIDYRGILKELDTAIKKYQDLADRTQQGYDIDDLNGLYRQVSAEYKRLPVLHDRLWKIFVVVENRKDLEQYRSILIPQYEKDAEGRNYDVRQKTREDFYVALTEYGMCLKTALSSRSFFEDSFFSESLIQTYKKDLSFFTSLRKIVRQDAHEAVDYSTYERQISSLVDKHIVGTGVREPEGTILVDELGQNKDPENWTKEKTRNETDVIKSRIERIIEQDLGDDPYAQQMFSELLRRAIEEADAMFDYPYKQYVLLRDLEEKISNREVDTVPNVFNDNRYAKAYYGVFRLVLGEEYFERLDKKEHDRIAELVFNIDKVVRSAVATYSISSQNMEAEIRKTLLKLLFEIVGLDNAKKIIERVIHITRVGVGKGAL